MMVELRKQVISKAVSNHAACKLTYQILVKGISGLEVLCRVSRVRIATCDLKFRNWALGQLGLIILLR